MEAVPRLPMLSFDLKVSPEPTSFGPKIKQYIRDFYHEDPEMYTSEIHTLEGLRATAVCAVRDVTGCSNLKKYYCQLHFLQSRFPMSKDGAAAVPFTWRDTYASMVCSLADIRFEMVSVLYNIGALHSQLGAMDSRVTADGMKMSCTHFQCAAWAFQHLKDSFPQPAGVDLAPDVMHFMYHLSLAQAQECILEKSMMDNRKATIIAKVAVQIVDYYNMALSTLEQGGAEDCSIAETVGSKIYKNWKRYVKFKIAYHTCISLLYRGQQAEEQQKMGERVTYYHAAAEKLEEAIKLSKGMDNIEAINEALTFTNDVVEGKKKAAKNENEFIYHEEVPPLDTLPEVKGASLVKGIPFNVNDPDVSGPDIFARLVPMKAHEASSLYSEEKAKLLRRIGAMIDEKDHELDLFMASLQLDYLKLHGEPDSLPQELVDRCAALSAKPNAIQNLIDSMNKLADTYQDVEGMLQDIKEFLELEEKKEKEYQEMMGKRPPSIVATDLTREANKYQEAHGKASESNQTLHKAMTLHISNLRILSLPLSELRKQIPALGTLNNPEDIEATKEMQQLVDKVDEMKKQRATLATQLRESTCQDDITHQLVTRTGESLDTIFSQEMQKHQRYVTIIEQNLIAQENILKALTEAYARYAGTRKAATEIVRKREATINALISSYDAYEDLLAKSNKGLEFYKKLETNVAKLLQRVKSTCKVQDEEREQILAKNSKVLPSSKLESVSADSGGPKLKDYLQSMKRSLPSGGYSTPLSYFPNMQPGSTPIAAATAPAVTGSGLSMQPPSYAVDGSGSSENVGGQVQWVPPVRPAPVGSEGTGESCSTSGKQDTVYQPAMSPNPAKLVSDYQLPVNVPYGASTQQYSYQYYQNIPYTGTQQQAYMYSNGQRYHQYQTIEPVPPAASTPTSAYVPYGTVSSKDVNQQHTATSAAYHPNSTYQGMSQERDKYNPVPTTLAMDQSYQPSVSQVQTSDLSQMYSTHTQAYGTDSSRNYLTNQQNFPSQLPAGPIQSNPPQHQVPPISALQQQVVGQQVYTSQAGGYNTAVATPQPTTQAAYDSSYSMYGYDKSVAYQYGSSYSAKNPVSTSSYYPSSQQPAYSGWQEKQQQYSQQQQPSHLQSSHQHPPHQQPQQHLQQQYQQQNLQGYNVQQDSTDNVQYPPSQAVTGTASLPQYHWQQQQKDSSVYREGASAYGSTAHDSQYYGSSQIISAGTSSLHESSSSQMPVQQQQQQQQQQYYSSSYGNVYPPASYPVQSSAVSGNSLSQSTQYQYMSGAGVSSYTNAGKYATSQTCSSQTSVDGQTFAAQYSANETLGNQGQAASSYYTVPYGSQYGTDAVSGTLPQSPHHVYQPNVPSQVQETSWQQQLVKSPMTYMQARTLGDATSTTFSVQGSSSSSSTEGKSSNSASSNIDLLAGLDFSLNQKPLIPQQPVASSPNMEQKTPSNTNVKNEESVQSALDTSISPQKGSVIANEVSSSRSDSHINLPVKQNSVSVDDQCPSKPKLETPDVNGSCEEDRHASKTVEKDPFVDSDILNQFVLEVEKYEKFVESLTTKTLNGPTPLDMKWKELLDLQEKDAHKRSISVARCYPMKNRFPDILPYDHSRVELPSTKDDYINASFITDLTPDTPRFIATQAPLQSTYTDFWTMVWEQQVEVIVCLLSNLELEDEVYWPQDKGSELAMGKMKLSLQSCNVHPSWIERIISICLTETRATRVVIHLQFTAWPGSSFPASPGPFLGFVSETLALHRQQRNLSHPVVVHCLSGVGRTGLFCLVCAAVCEVRAGRGLTDLVATAALMSSSRKACLRDREHLKFAYQAVLYYAQDLLMKRGILRSCSTFEDKRNRGGKCHTRHPSEDFLLGPPTALSQLQSGLEKMGSGKPSS